MVAEAARQATRTKSLDIRPAMVAGAVHACERGGTSSASLLTPTSAAALSQQPTPAADTTATAASIRILILDLFFGAALPCNSSPRSTLTLINELHFRQWALPHSQGSRTVRADTGTTGHTSTSRARALLALLAIVARGVSAEPRRCAARARRREI